MKLKLHCKVWYQTGSLHQSKFFDIQRVTGKLFSVFAFLYLIFHGTISDSPPSGQWRDLQPRPKLTEDINDNLGLFPFQIIPLESFKAQSWNGSFVAVVAGGDGIPLTFSNRSHYVDLALEFRLHEMDKQVDKEIVVGFAYN